MLGIGFSGTRSRFRNNTQITPSPLPGLTPSAFALPPNLKNKALVTALQFILNDCPDLLPAYRDSEKQTLNILLTPPKKEEMKSQPRSQGLSFGRDPGCGWSHASEILGGKLKLYYGSVGWGGRGACLSRFKITTFIWVMKFKFTTRNREENS